jgi:glycosyltransferase involved in cell wall biosynthesis
VPSVAIACDHLVQRGGAERVVLSMLRAFPGSPLYTSMYRPENIFDEFRSADVHPSVLNRIPAFRRWHRVAFPLMAPAFATHRIDAEVVLASTAGWAHGVRTDGALVLYCHSPARWLYQPLERYTGRSHAQRALVTALRPVLLKWDRWAAGRSVKILANSRAVQAAIHEAYHRDSLLLPPPVTIDAGGEQQRVEGLTPGFLLAVGRMLPYKNIDRIVAAFADLPGERLVVVGKGPDRQRLDATRTRNVTLLADASDAEMRWLYASCVGHVTASYEDFGLTPVEAAAFGKPTAALRFGGFLDTVADGQTGLFFDSPNPSDIASGVRRLVNRDWDERTVQAHADAYDEVRFITRLRDVVAGVASFPRRGGV